MAHFESNRAPLTIALTLAAAVAAKSGDLRADPSELPPEVGHNYGEIETPRTAAMGGAIRAWSNSLSALFINPAGMTMSRVYHFGALAQIWPEAKRQSYGGGAVDSIVSSSRLAGGIGGTWTLQDPDGIDRTVTDVRFALGLPVGDAFHIGIGGRYFGAKQEGFGPFGPSPASGGLADESIIRAFSFDAGTILKLGDNFALGVVGNNLSNPDNGMMPTSVGGGFGFGNETLTIEADAVFDFTTWERSTVRGMGGIEFLAADHFPLRAGYRYDAGADSHSVSGGLGYLEREFSVDLAVRRVVVGDVATAVIFGFAYHLESTGIGNQSEF